MRRTTSETLTKKYNCFVECGQDITAAAKKLGIAYGTLERDLRQYRQMQKADITSKIIIDGIKAEEHVDIDEIRDYLYKISDRAASKVHRLTHQTIEVPYESFVLCMISDMHIGGKSDYRQIDRDVELITNHDRAFAILAGDDLDNFIIGKLVNIQRAQPTTGDMELRYCKHILQQLAPSTLVYVSGNHNKWSKKLTGHDLFRELFTDFPMLFDNDEVRFKLKTPHIEEKWLVRHRFKWGSIFNPTHGQEVNWERGDYDFDVVMGGHTHIATLFREFIKHDKLKLAIQLGTYKMLDDFQQEMNFPRSYSQSRGSASIVYHKGHKFYCRSIEQGIALYDTLATLPNS
jgi:predicted phosphodiesterase